MKRRQTGLTCRRRLGTLAAWTRWSDWAGNLFTVDVDHPPAWLTAPLDEEGR